MKHHYVYKINKRRVILYKKRFFSALFATSISGITDKFHDDCKNIACK